jgi:hypothetical protein
LDLEYHISGIEAKSFIDLESILRWNLGWLETLNAMMIDDHVLRGLNAEEAQPNHPVGILQP